MPVFKVPGGGNASCSASVIGTKHAVVTAAHCCYDQGKRKWMSIWNFAPGQDGSGVGFSNYTLKALSFLATSLFSNRT